MRAPHCVAICHNAMRRREASSPASPSHQPLQCGGRWATHGLPTEAICIRSKRPSRWRTNVAFFHQYFGFTNNQALAPFANEQCRCKKYFMGGEGGWEHVNSCIYHSQNFYCAHNHVLRALESICTDTGYSTEVKMVLTSEGNQYAFLEKYSTSACRSRPMCW